MNQVRNDAMFATEPEVIKHRSSAARSRRVVRGISKKVSGIVGLLMNIREIVGYCRVFRGFADWRCHGIFRKSAGHCQALSGWPWIFVKMCPLLSGIVRSA